MKKHITQILLDRGYTTWGFGGRIKNQNANAKAQNDYLLKRSDIIFLEGDIHSEKNYFMFPKPKDQISTMLVGGLCVNYIKDVELCVERIVNDENVNDLNRVMWGLGEAHSPPTLLSPLPNVVYKKMEDLHKYDKNFNKIGTHSKREVTLSAKRADAINHCLMVENHEDILENMFSGKVYKYVL